MKPVELIERAITNSSKTRDIVLDLFGGSGTTLIPLRQETSSRKFHHPAAGGRYLQVRLNSRLLTLT